MGFYSRELTCLRAFEQRLTLSDEDSRTLLGCCVETRMKRIKLTQAWEQETTAGSQVRSDSACVLKVELRGFVEEANVRCEDRGGYRSHCQVDAMTTASGQEVSLFTVMSLIGNKSLSWKPTAHFPSSPICCHWSGHVVGTSEARKPTPVPSRPCARRWPLTARPR